MKKIIYVSDYTLKEYNSVRDILYNLICHPNMLSYEQIIIQSSGKMYKPIKTTTYDGFKTYSNSQLPTLDYLKEKNAFFLHKIKYLLHFVIHKLAALLKSEKIYQKYDNLAFINNILKKEKPDLVVFLIYSPKKRYADLCKKHKIPYIFTLYDTYIGRPETNKKEAYKTEKYVIENSEKYFIPDFFYSLYATTYNNKKIQSIDLPLLIPKSDVIKAYENITQKTNFSYFGVMQSFRNGEKIKSILSDLNIKLDIFSTQKYENDETFCGHQAITKPELYNTVAGSKFLVVFDNSFPYQDYLPSKAYLYASFTKPIIAFGDNETSALKEFFKDYKRFYYQNINDSTYGLTEFLNKDFGDDFDIDCYKKYSKYLPETALKPITEKINKILNT